MATNLAEQKGLLIMATFDGFASPYLSAPLSQITPFTYRDGVTYLEKLNALCLWIEYVKETLQTNLDAIANADETALNLLTAQINSTILSFTNEWQETLASLEDIQAGDVARDPTTGVYTPINLIIGHVYDNTRYYAYFAEQLDSLDLTAAQWDALDVTARHFDLALAYSPITTQATNDTPVTVLPN